MRNLYFIYIFALSFVPVLVQETLLFNIGTFGVYLVDVLDCIVLLAILRILPVRKGLLCSVEELLFVLLLIWLIVEILLGSTRFGYRALGESRTVMNFFSFVLPYAVLYRKRRSPSAEETLWLLRGTVLCAAAGALLFFFLGPFMGMTTTDFRGEKVLGSQQTFYVLVSALWLLVKRPGRGVARTSTLLLGVILLLLGIFSKNRTPLVALGMVLSFYLLFSGRLRSVLGIASIGLVMFLSASFIFPKMTDEAIAALQGISDPSTDHDFQWRVLVQDAALEQGLSNLWMGEGFGNYYEIVYPGQYGMEVSQAPPHNQFLTLFLKAGVIGVALCLVAMTVFCFRLFRGLSGLSRNSLARSGFVLILLIVFSQFLYGMAYDFIPFYGIYCGLGCILLKCSGSGSDESTAEPAHAETA
jgi:O-Antigen ligase